MVSIYGFHLRRERYGGRFRDYCHGLRDSQSYSEDKIAELQSFELQKLLTHAFDNVPFYHELQQRNGWTARQFSTAVDLQKLPIVTKEQFRSNTNDFRSKMSALRGKAFKLSTSGTSGKPLTVYCDTDSRRHHYAFWQRLRGWFGIQPGMRRATFFGRIAVSPEQTRPPFWRYDIFQRNYLFSSYHMSEANLKHYYEKLVEVQPEEIIGYPSSLFILAKYMKKNNLGGVRPKAVFTTAETLLEHQRAIIGEAFGRSVVDQYGCTEMALFVSQCEEGTYHVHPEHGIVEVVDESGKPVQNGEEGEAVCTGFVNYAMPVIRYRLGDRLVLDSERCRCGRNFPVVRQIIGRTDDILITPDGRPLGRLDPVFKGMSGIYETQIIQTSRDCLLLKLVADADFNATNREELLYEVRKRTGNEMKVELELVDEIPKDSNGKFKSVISKVAE